MAIKSRNVRTVASLAGVVSLLLLLQSASVAAISPPQVGTTYTWEVKATNGVFEWITNNWESLGNQTISPGDRITYNLTGQYPNDEFQSNLSDPVWWGELKFLVKNNSGNFVVNFSIANVSTTEIGNAMALSVILYDSESFAPRILWAAGFVVDTNWTRNLAILEGYNTTMVNVSNEASVFKVWFKNAFQDSYLAYDKTTGVLLYANTTVGNYHMELELLGGYATIPGYAGEIILAAMILAGGIVAFRLGTKKLVEKR